MGFGQIVLEMLKIFEEPLAEIVGQVVLLQVGLEEQTETRCVDPLKGKTHERQTGLREGKQLEYLWFTSRAFATHESQKRSKG